MSKRSYKLFAILLLMVSVVTAYVVVGYSTPGPVAGLRMEKSEVGMLARETGVIDIIDYDSFVWVVVSAEARLAKTSAAQSYELLLGGEVVETHHEPADPAGWSVIPTSGSHLNLVQMIGPTKPEWLDDVRTTGVEIVQYIHPFTYVVWGDDNQMVALEKEPAVRWQAAFAPAWAVQPANREPLNKIEHHILIYRGAENSAPQALAAITGETYPLKTVDEKWTVTTAWLDAPQLQAAAAVPGVMAVQPVIGRQLRGELSNQIVAGRFDNNGFTFPGYRSWLDGLGVTGSGVIVAHVDQGIAEGHPDLSNRLAPCNAPSCSQNSGINEPDPNHGTHTASIIAGDGASGAKDAAGFLRGQGVAPAAMLVSQIYDPFALETDGALKLMSDGVRNGAIISSNSWGYTDYAVGYDINTKLVDSGVRDADPAAAGHQPLLYVISQWNGEGGYQEQGSPDEGKNILGVGGTRLQDQNDGTLMTDGNGQARISDLSPVSAHGPALDMRDIPFLVAPGYFVDSAGNPDNWGLLWGNSVAAPHVAGAAALFVDYYRDHYATTPSPAMMKAALAVGATSLAGHFDANNINTMGHPQDSKQGWGRVNLSPVIDPALPSYHFDQAALLTSSGDEWRMKIAPIDPNQPMRLMLVWTDAPGHGLGGATPAWNNNLDLRVENGGTLLLGNHFDANGWSVSGGSAEDKNNSEAVFILNPSANGDMFVTVRAANISSDGVPDNGFATDQDFALVCTNCEGGFKLLLPYVVRK